tara:strand:+ start:32 stop:238 length:207 start_codon:yes stop_codon:yes gene_type:complete
MYHYGYSVHAKIITMKRDLYRFAKERRDAKPRKYKQIKLTKKAFMFEEDEWYRRFNLATYKINTNKVG